MMTRRPSARVKFLSATGQKPALVAEFDPKSQSRTETMKKVRFLLAIAILGFTACTTNPVAPDGPEDCNPEITDCVKPTTGN